MPAGRGTLTLPPLALPTVPAATKNTPLVVAVAVEEARTPIVCACTETHVMHRAPKKKNRCLVQFSNIFNANRSIILNCDLPSYRSQQQPLHPALTPGRALGSSRC